MLGALRKFFATPEPGPDWSEVAQWAERGGYAFKRARDDEGFVVEGSVGGRPWRLEWGPPQRDFIGGRELRHRMEAGLPGDLQMLLMSRPLVEQLERRTFEQSVEGARTQIDTSTPEEMRWLVMFQKVNLGRARELRARFGAVANVPDAAAAWIDGALALQLERAGARLLADDPPFLLMTHRGRVYQRLHLPEVEVAALATATALFEAAVEAALRVAGARADLGGQTDTGITGWQPLGSEVPQRRD